MRRKYILFLLFFFSGFSSLVYQVVWLRLAFAEFGVITPVVSVVLSVFMLGLSLGSWISGKWVGQVSAKLRASPMIFYGLAEIVVGFGAFAVPRLFHFFGQRLLGFGEMDSGSYLLVSGGAILISLLPWCVFMGMTFPLMISYMKTESPTDEGEFSFLYLANVIGAMTGTALTAAVLVELLGFHKTLDVAALSNFTIGAVGILLGFNGSVATSPSVVSRDNQALGRDRAKVFTLLFLTGFCSLGMEVVWTRAFTPITETTIYAFAFLLTTYLFSTWIGSYFYRKHLLLGKVRPLGEILGLLAASSLLPLVLNDPRLTPTVYHIFFSLFPVCALLGYLTPYLVDHYSQGRAELVGSAYAVNVLGCILGPLLAGYILLQYVGVKWSLFVLALPVLVFAGYEWMSTRRLKEYRWIAATVSVLILVSLFSRTYEWRRSTSHDQVRRDSTATVISTGEGMNKQLLVNGYGITVLTPITKIMGHFPLSLIPGKPESALVICFGMGTTFRSLTSWGIDTTAVELVPSVKAAFGYYFADAEEVLRRPNSRVVIDDGRRFLRRSSKKYDVITLDPPPPVEAAGSSLLYSRQFYDVVKAHLKPNGILQQWFPGGETAILNSVARSISDAFPYVRVYHSIQGWGYHFIASENPIPEPNADELVSRIPEQARADLMEWFPGENIREVFREILSRETPLPFVLGTGDVPMMSDDRPFNEYFLVRRPYPFTRGYPFSK